MDDKNKRKFNWSELSSEEEEVDTPKKVLKKEDKNAIDEQADKLKDLTFKSKDQSIKNEVNLEEEEIQITNTRSTRRKRGHEEVETVNDGDKNVKSTRLSKSPMIREEKKSLKMDLKESSTRVSRSSMVKDEKKSPNMDSKESSTRVSRSSMVKDEKKSPNMDLKKHSKSDQNLSIKEENLNTGGKENGDSKSSIKKENLKKGNKSTIDQTPLNMLPNKNMKSAENAPSSQELNLGASVKSVKMKVAKQKASSKFNRKKINSLSPIKKISNKFTKINIQSKLDEQHRNWIQECIKQYDGEYDKEFDPESEFYKKAKGSKRNSRY